MGPLALVVHLVVGLPTHKAEFGLGTVFSAHGDSITNPNPSLACYPIKDTRYRVGDRRRHTHKILDDKHDFVVALPKRYPCLAWVWIYCPRTGLSVMARIADRGPKHAKIDMSKPVAHAIGHNGKEPVAFIVFK